MILRSSPFLDCVIVSLISLLSSPCHSQVISQSNLGTTKMAMPPLRGPVGMIFEPEITDVSAMCSPDGITAQVMFKTPFYGKIYSQQYAQSHECMYYNSYDMNMILFTIPNYACGTQVERNSLNQVSSITNEVYVQYDKDTQTAHDRRFLFICRLVDDFGGGNGIGGGGSGTFTNRPIGNGFTGGHGNTVTPGQTIIVQTATPTNIVVSQSSLDAPAVAMEIQDGEGPFAKLVQRALQLGDAMTLVVKADAPGTQMDIFVHSCKAGDGAEREVLLVDDKGCTARRQVAGQMQRTRDAMGRLIYYFSMKAFKFPGNDDVYFTCSVDLCADCATKTICPGTFAEGSNDIRRRSKRSVNWLQQPVFRHSYNRAPMDVLNYTEVKDYVRVSELAASAQPVRQSQTFRHCVDISIVYALSAVVGALFVVLIVITVVFISHTRRGSDAKSKSASGSSSSPPSTRQSSISSISLPTGRRAEDRSTRRQQQHNHNYRQHKSQV